MAIRKVLFVDDDATLRAAAVRTLTSDGYEVSTAGSPDEALRLALDVVPDLAIIDLYYGAQRLGLKLASELRAQLRGIAIVICSGLLHVPIEELLALGLHDVTLASKPVSFRALLAGPGGSASDLTCAVDEWPTLTAVKREHIARTITALEGNVSRTARILDRDRAALQRLLKKLAIDPAASRAPTRRER